MSSQESKTIDKLSSLDQWGHRLFIIPAEVKGRFRKYRSYLEAFLILFFLLLPWTKINGVQTLLLDVANRRFSILGVQFYSHDGPLLFFVFAVVMLSLFFATAVWGRIWCGWACPQTVFIDGVYRRIEKWIEGNYIERRRLYNQPMDFNKFLKYSLKWISFVAVSSVIAHSFIAYFSGSDALIKMIFSGPESHWSYFLIVTIITAILTFNFGWFREQFCIIMCPYGRFQSVLQDSKTVTVMYDAKRGEARKGMVQPGQTQGDCVSCNRCVQVCPTGIDIRNGIQMECIACSACVDACDEIMTKVKKPTGLIGYNSLRGGKVKIFSPRTAVYLFLITIFSAGIIYNFVQRSSFMVTLLRAKDTPYQLVSNPDGERMVINHFKVHLHNQTFDSQVYKVELPVGWEDLGFKLTTPMEQIRVAGGHERVLHFFLLFPEKVLNNKGELRGAVRVNQLQSDVNVEKEMIVVGPAQSN